MAELRFDILGEHGEVPATTFKDSIQYAIYLLREFDSAISGKPRGVLGWYIERLRSNGDLSVVFRSKARRTPSAARYPQDVDKAVASHLVSGFEDIEIKCETPPYLSEFALQKVDKLANLIGKDGTKGFHIESQSKETQVTRKTQENIRRLLPISRIAIGSVEGTLEVVNLHNKPRFMVYDAISHKGVTCEFDPERFMEKIKDSLGRTVAVFGDLHKNIKGDTLRVSVDRLEVIDAENRFRPLADRPEWDDPEFTKSRGSHEYLRSIRGR